MKLFKQLSIIFVVLFATQIVLAQSTDDEPCRLILKNGLYKTFKIVRTASFEQDLKTYFSSAAFKSDFKNRQWNGDINVVVPVEGVPIPVGLKAGASDEAIEIFQQRVASATSLKVDQSFYDFALSSVPDVDLAKEYTQCLIATRRFGFRPFVDVGESEVTFNISYKKEFEADVMPTVRNFTVLNGQVLSGSLKVGDKIGNDNTVIVKRLPDKDLIFLFETDKGGFSQRIPGESAGFNKDLPLGTIIASYLNFEQFSAVTSNNINSPGNLWTARFSKWSPADGRPILLSKLQLIANTPNVPDLRGVFLRGLNQFDPQETSTVSSDRKDPDNRIRGSLQSDAFQNHVHSLSHVFFTSPVQSQAQLKTGLKEGGNFGERGISLVDTPTSNGATGQAQGETRPKNVAIFYYIRIN